MFFFFFFLYTTRLSSSQHCTCFLLFTGFSCWGQERVCVCGWRIKQDLFLLQGSNLWSLFGRFHDPTYNSQWCFFFPYWRYVYKDFWSGFRRWSESLFHVTLLQQPSCRWQSTAPKTINNTRAGKNWWIRSEKYKLNCRLFSWEHIAGYCPAVLISVSLCVSWEKASLGLNIGNRAKEVIEGDQKIQLYSIHCMLSASDIYWKMCWQFFWFFWAHSGCFARHVTFWTHWHKTKADVIFLMCTIHWMQCLVKICSNHVNNSDKMLQIPLKRYSLTWLSIKTFYLIHFLCRPYRRSVQSCSRICEAVSVSMLMVAG